MFISMDKVRLSIRPSSGASGEEILHRGGGRGRRERKLNVACVASVSSRVIARKRLLCRLVVIYFDFWRGYRMELHSALRGVVHALAQTAFNILRDRFLKPGGKTC